MTNYHSIVRKLKEMDQMTASQFKVGDRVRFRAGQEPLGIQADRAVYVVTSINPRDIGPVKVRKESAPFGTIYGGYYDSRFERVEPAADPSMDRNAIFTLAAAKDARRRIIEATGLGEKVVRVRSRSWDNEGQYFAVDVATAGGNRKLYRPEDVEKFLAEQKPEDLTPFNAGTVAGVPKFQFRAQARYIPAPDGSYWWTMGDITTKGGVVEFNGKRYRLGETKFVPFVS